MATFKWWNPFTWYLLFRKKPKPEPYTFPTETVIRRREMPQVYPDYTPKKKATPVKEEKRDTYIPIPIPVSVPDYTPSRSSDNDSSSSWGSSDSSSGSFDGGSSSGGGSSGDF